MRLRRLDRYLARNFIGGCIPVLLLLAGLFGFLAFAEELEDIDQGSYRLGDAIRVVALTLPDRLVDLLPVIALLGALLGLGALANSRELTAMRAAGVSPPRLARPVLGAALALVAGGAALQFQWIPDWERQAALLRSKTTSVAPMGVFESEFWTRGGNQFVRVGQVLFGSIPSQIEIYTLDERGGLMELLRADSAIVLGPREWLLREVRISRPGETRGAETRIAELNWQSFLSPEQMSSLVLSPAALAPSDLYRYIRRLERNGLNTHRYRLALWQQLSLPLGLIGMSLLAIPFLLGSVRNASVGARTALGGAIGIAFYLVEQIIGHVASLLEFAPAPAALAPDLAILSIAIVALNRVR